MVKLVPLDAKHELDFTMLHPEGWQVDVTGLKDGVQIIDPPLHIRISTRQLREMTPPATVEEMVKDLGPAALDASVREVRVSGTQKAYEAEYRMINSSGESSTSLDLFLYGKTYYQIVSTINTSERFMEWKPVFEEILASFKPSNLDAIPLPGRP